VAKKRPRVPKTVKYAPAKELTSFQEYNPEINTLVQSLPPGNVAVLCSEMARYSSFWVCLNGLILPRNSRNSIHTGAYVVDNAERATEMFMEQGHEDWIMLLGDDHMFSPHMALKLLALMYHHDLDCIVPICFKRSFPPIPVLYKHDDETGLPTPYLPEDLHEGGLKEVTYAGSAGMIIRRRVMEAMSKPRWELSPHDQYTWGEDLLFCKKLNELGFKIHADLDLPLGHTLNATLWPSRDQTGQFGCHYDFANQGGFFLGT